MHPFLNNTSPYARIARVALEEKGYSDVGTELVDPWADAPALLAANTAARVPALVTDQGPRLTESLLIVLWLESERPTPTLLGEDRTATIARAGVAMGVIDAAVHTLIGRKITDASFDISPVGLRRRRSMVDGLRRLESDPPRYEAGTPDLAAIASVVALDYVRFRFPQADWMPAVPQLDRLAVPGPPRSRQPAVRPRPRRARREARSCLTELRSFGGRHCSPSPRPSPGATGRPLRSASRCRRCCRHP